MARFRAAYPPEFRRQTAELVLSGRTPEELSREFEPTAHSIANWGRRNWCNRPASYQHREGFRPPSCPDN